MVLFGYPEHVGDHQHGERLGVGADEFAVAVGHELVELPIGQVAHELLAPLKATGREEAHQQRPLAGVLRGIHGDHVLVHR
jgi:hypothetical protein